MVDQPQTQRLVLYLNGFPIIDTYIDKALLAQSDKSVEAWYHAIRDRLNILLRITCVHTGESVFTLPDKIQHVGYITQEVDISQLGVGVPQSLPKIFLKAFQVRVGKHLTELTEYWQQSTI